jgi:glucose-1-phosphate adenylyltransferase
MTSEIQKQELAIASIVLAGGKGVRLFPLTKFHSKPAVSFGGRYRLIDVPISNSLNSNIRQIFILGQYLTAELQQHLAQTYQFDKFFPGTINFLTPEELPSGERIWFDGTADAVRKSLPTILKNPADYFLILSGDQLYNINFTEMLEFAIKSNANLTIASLPVNATDAQRLGLLKIDENFKVVDFVEKPKDPEILKNLELPTSFVKKLNKQSENLTHLGSMGIYIFKREELIRLLEEDPRDDFGKHLIPTEIKRKKTVAYVYKGYWEDIGTIASYYNANLDLTYSPSQGIKTYDETNPIYSSINYLTGPKIGNSKISNSIVCEGSIIEAKEIEHSIVGLRSNIKEGAIIKDSILLGNRYYLPPSHQNPPMPINFEIGANSIIEKAIIDEHVYIGKNVKLINKAKLDNYDSKEGIYIRDGIIVVAANTTIPDNFIL